VKHLNLLTKTAINKLYRKRIGESKIGDVCKTLTGKNIIKELAACDAKYVLIGLPEDIGVRANYGRQGAHSAWLPTLTSLLNTQSNLFFTGKNLLILGSVNFDDLLEKAASLTTSSATSIKKLRELTELVDERVEQIIFQIIKNNKVPLIIGGGHNNSFPNIAAAYKALKTKVHVFNCDAHADFRPIEGRHSGNGFSYAYKNNYINKYFILGLHESYNSQKVLSHIQKTTNVRYSTFEDIFIREKISFKNAVFEGVTFLKSAPCGIELDIDSIQNAPASAKTSSGITPVMARQYAYWCGKNTQAIYFHIAEAAPVLSHIKTDNKTGKLITYLLIDFIKGCSEK